MDRKIVLVQPKKLAMETFFFIKEKDLPGSEAYWQKFPQGSPKEKNLDYPGKLQKSEE